LMTIGIRVTCSVADAQATEVINHLAINQMTPELVLASIARTLDPIVENLRALGALNHNANLSVDTKTIIEQKIRQIVGDPTKCPWWGAG